MQERLECRHQSRWVMFKGLSARIAQALAGRPAFICPGNHDFISLAALLKGAGVEVYAISSDQCVEWAGLRWTGFREIAAINGRWCGEVDASTLRACALAALAHTPDILVTHTPPAGVLDGVDVQDHIGAPEMAEAIAAMAQPPLLHLFGHVHGHGGERRTIGATMYANGATCMEVIEPPRR